MIIKQTLVTLILLMSALVFADDTKPDGRMLVNFELINGEEVATEAIILPGVIPPKDDERGVNYRLYDADNKILASGYVLIERRIFHDKTTTNGNFVGKVAHNTGKITVALPFYKNAANLEIRGKKTSKISMSEIRQRRASAPPMLTKSLKQPNYIKYLETLHKKAFHKLFADEEPIHPSKTVNSATAIKVKITCLVDNLTKKEKEDLAVEVRVSNSSTFELISKKTVYPYAKPRKCNIKIESGNYDIVAVAKTGDKKLFPLYQIIYDFDPVLKEIKFNWENTKLVKTSVVTSKGAKLKSYLTIVENKYTGSTNQLAMTWAYPDENGQLELWLPPRTFTFVVEPFDALNTPQFVRVKRIRNKKRGAQKFKIIVPEYTEVGGSALKKIWDNGPDDGRYNFIFLSEAYTDLNEPFIDENGNGIWDGDLLLDENANGVWDKGEHFTDRNNNKIYDEPEPFTDLNGDQMCNRFERAQFELTAAMMTAFVMNFEPFKSFSDRMNVYTYWTPSIHGVQKMPGFPTPWNDMITYYGVECGGFYFGLDERGKFTLYSRANPKQINKSVSEALPYAKFYVVLVRDPFNVMVSNSAILQSASSMRGGAVLVHEMGHRVGGLSDEYVYGGEAWKEYTRVTDIYTPNLTFVTDPAKAKWSHLLSPDTIVPTPLSHDGYGLFEGGSWAKGIYRPTNFSMMRSSVFPFFKVNEDAIRKVLNKYK